MMHSSSASLCAGLQEHCARRDPAHGGHAGYQLGWLAATVGLLIEGNKSEKLDARKELQKLIGRGRCLLNAADLAKKQEAN